MPPDTAKDYPDARSNGNAGNTGTNGKPGEAPPFRRLRGYAFDPSLSLRLETAAINHTSLEIPWEANLKPGPCGEYVEVVDVDPASGGWYEPVDLNAEHILAQDGLPPSQGNPQFHQQMVYAVAMNTIANFEKALGRQVMWSPRSAPHDGGSEEGDADEEFVGRLRIYPHAMRAANAYYSPRKKALLFGYFQGPTGTVFSCLSQDIIVHETTHALLDGMHGSYVEDNHWDTLAFHEAFADLVALFQHFTFPEILKHQIERTRGDLECQSLLGELAQEFGEATGRYGALREAIGETGADGTWQLIKPDPKRLHAASEPHQRGAVLVAAVFAAFLAIYKTRARRVLAIANTGHAQAATGEMHPALIDALATEATKTAKHFLYMCIRALDYCPPFDITFGDYLRALVTADYDMVPKDTYGYRVALIESFRRWGIVPDGLKVLSEEQLRWPPATQKNDAAGNSDVLKDTVNNLKQYISVALYAKERKAVFRQLKTVRNNTRERLEALLSGRSDAKELEKFMAITGLKMTPAADDEDFEPAGRKTGLNVDLALPALRVTPDGRIKKQLIFTVTQKREEKIEAGKSNGKGSVELRRGCTLIYDLEGREPKLLYAITRPLDDEKRVNAIRRYKQSKRTEQPSLREAYFDGLAESIREEPFCFLHEDY